MRFPFLWLIKMSLFHEFQFEFNKCERNLFINTYCEAYASHSEGKFSLMNVYHLIENQLGEDGRRGVVYAIFK